ncbi:cytochrome P450 [Phlyctema vagabunda]|uniref:Cytochrome P450 n=1 Tax=Phlyctema vagabunda TaxID=108571 RepID=A0ABR4PRI8_9HELO
MVFSRYISMMLNGLIILTITALLYRVFIVSYRIWIHPLRRYRGPKIWAASRLPYAYHSFNGTINYQLERLHNKYGPVVRITPNELSYTNAEAWDDIYTRSPHGKAPLKKSRNFAEPENGVRGLLTAPDEKSHGRMRRVLSPGFSEKAVRDQEPIISIYFDQLMQRLKENCGKPVDMQKWFSFFAFDVIGDLTFGESFKALETSKEHPWISTFTNDQRTNVLMALSFRFTPLDQILLKLIPESMREKQRAHKAFGVAGLRERLSYKKPRQDFLVNVQKTIDTPQGFSMAEMEDTIPILVIAGAETTSTALAGAVYYLATNPAAYKKLTAEIRGAFKSEEEINMVSVNNLSYELAVLNETLRILPPAPSTLPRITPREGSMICGHFVPGNTIVGVNYWSAFHSPSNFRDPYRFVPERWLTPEQDEMAERYQNDQKKVAQPFSVGPRNCLGRVLAYAEMKVVLARLIWNFDLQLREEPQAWSTSMKHWIIYAKLPLWMDLKPVVRE